MDDFNEKLKDTMERAILKMVADGGLVLPSYESRMRVPPEWMAEAWSLVDSESLKRKLAERIESELVERLVNHMATELAWDIKQVLSVRERREALRDVVRENLDRLTKETRHD